MNAAITPSAGPVLAGLTAVVTGAARGLGLAIANGLLAAGARVVLTDREAPTVVRPVSDAALALALDVCDETAFDQVLARTLAHFGRLDIWVNNAALSPPTALWDIGAAEWDAVMAVNLRGAFFGCRSAGRHMRLRGSGRIINLASLAGQAPSAASGVHYAASKAGLLALTRSFALELAPHGVTVNAVAPSAIESPALRALPEARRSALLRSIPAGRFGLADEVAAAVVHLASPAAGYSTGTTLDINGGRLMR